MTNGFFGDITTEGLEKTGDSLGGFTLFDTDVYKAKIAVAYGIQADSGAKGVAFHFDLEMPEGGTKEFRYTTYITSGTAKGGKNYYERDGKKMPLPGFALVEDICVLCHPQNAGLSGQKIEERHVPVWDKEAQKEVPRPVPVLVDLLDKEVYLAIERVKEDKKAKGDDGVFRNTGETRESNDVQKAMHFPSKMTVTEAREGKAATYLDAWQKKNKGNIRDKTTGSSEGKPGAPGAKPQAGASGGQTAAGLFNKPGG